MTPREKALEKEIVRLSKAYTQVVALFLKGSMENVGIKPSRKTKRA
jgi:hypothetical protein